MNGQPNALPLFLIVFHICFGMPSASARNLTDPWVEELVGELVENQIVEGISIGYIEGKHWGIVHLGSATRTGKNADNLTLYEIGSISKVFTSILLADAVVRGEIDLNGAASVTNKAQMQLPTRDGKSIQWIDLSTHRSGLPRLPENFDPTDPNNPYRDYNSTKAAEFLNQYQLPRKPGQSWEYSNFGASVLGYLISQNAHKSYQQLLQERITKPLRMTDCTVTLSSNQKKRMAVPHNQVGSATAPWTFADLPGAGGIRATMRDMMRFAKAQIIPPKGSLGDAINLAWKQQHAADASGPAMGLGWILMGDGHTRWHNGGTGGSTTALFINRKSASAVVILCNTSVVGGELDQLAIQLIQKASGQKVALPTEDRGGRNNAPPKLSPFTDVQFKDKQILVVYQGQTYQWLELDDISVEDIIASSKKQFGAGWQKRIREDLVELLWGMDHKPGEEVKLRLLNLKTKQDVVEEKAPMTRKNREAVSAKQPGMPVEQAKNKSPIDAKHRRRLVGRYQIIPSFIMNVREQGGRLTVTATNQSTLNLQPESPTHWSCVEVEAMLEFKLGKTGPAKSLILHQNGAKQMARRIN